MKSLKGTIKRRCPFTGRLLPEPQAKHDPINPKPLPEKVKQGETARVADALAKLRGKWVDIGPSKRAGITGEKLIREYRKLSLEFRHLTGDNPPPIYADL